MKNETKTPEVKTPETTPIVIDDATLTPSQTFHTEAAQAIAAATGLRQNYREGSILHFERIAPLTEAQQAALLDVMGRTTDGRLDIADSNYVWELLGCKTLDAAKELRLKHFGSESRSQQEAGKNGYKNCVNRCKVSKRYVLFVEPQGTAAGPKTKNKYSNTTAVPTDRSKIDVS